MYGHGRAIGRLVLVFPVDMTGVTGLSAFSQLTLQTVGQGTQVSFAGNSILFVGVTKAQLTAASFTFAAPGKDLVTLHIYSPPIKSMNVFSPAKPADAPEVYNLVNDTDYWCV